MNDAKDLPIVFNKNMLHPFSIYVRNVYILCIVYSYFRPPDTGIAILKYTFKFSSVYWFKCLTSSTTMLTHKSCAKLVPFRKFHDFIELSSIFNWHSTFFCFSFIKFSYHMTQQFHSTL